jgi:aminobutyraldehyde dehydrogenase
MQTQMLIGGNFEQGREAGLPLINPRTGEGILDLAEASLAQVDAAVEAAAAAFAGWRRTTPAERAGLMLKLADRV